jgi:hypothetical protein
VQVAEALHAEQLQQRFGEGCGGQLAQFGGRFAASKQLVLAHERFGGRVVDAADHGVDDALRSLRLGAGWGRRSAGFVPLRLGPNLRVETRGNLAGLLRDPTRYFMCGIAQC